MSLKQVPVVDFATSRGSGRAAFVRELGEALEAFGFVSVANSGVDPALVTRCYETTAALFDLPEAVKRRYETPEDGRQRGYTSFGIEHAKDQALPDLKEFWHVGRELPAHHPLRVRGAIPVNQNPTELPAVARDLGALFEAQDRFINGLLACVGEYLGFADGFFEEAVRDGNSVLRAIHYPPLGEDAPEGAVRAAQHEDINLMTSLPVSTASGLELLTRDGTWMALNPPPGVMVCDTGDMMALLTHGQMPATTHRVVNPPGALARRPRFSMPFFCHPHPDFVLKQGADGGEDVTAGGFLRQRLIDIGVG